LSYEKDLEAKLKDQADLPGRLNISVIKYLWQANPLNNAHKDSIPRFLRKLEIFKNLTDNDLRVFSKYLHLRNFSSSEVIFRQHDTGLGLYFIYSGMVDITVDKDTLDMSDEKELSYVLSLEKYDYFGELSLLHEHGPRSATAFAREATSLLGFLRPDLEEMMEDHPILAAKLLQSISQIVANRLFALTKELKRLKFKIGQLENNNGTKL
jgi:CRP/FNR family transcriptional regulator, cyclic AMP receptor protein